MNDNLISIFTEITERERKGAKNSRIKKDDSSVCSLSRKHHMCIYVYSLDF